MASTRPRCASEVTSATPVRPRAVRSRKKPSQPAPSSAELTCSPRISRCPSPVHAGGHKRVDVDDPATLADLQHQGVGGQERIRAGVQRPSAELLDLPVEVAGHLRNLRLRQPGDPQRLDQLLHPPRADPEQVAGRHHGRQGSLGPAAALQQPVREVRPRPQLGDRHVQGAGAGVEVPMPVTVTDIGPLGASSPVLGAADSIGLRGHQRVDEGGQHLPQQIRTGLGQLLGQEVGRVDTARCGHRVCLLRTVEGLQDHAMAALHDYATPNTGPDAHHSGGRHSYAAARSPRLWVERSQPWQSQPVSATVPRVYRRGCRSRGSCAGGR